MRISYEEAMMTNPIVVLMGEAVEKLESKNYVNRYGIKDVKSGTPMKFSLINAIIHRELEGVDYIDFWCGTEIYV